MRNIKKLLLADAVVCVVCFVLANVFHGNHAGTSRTVSDVFWVAFLVTAVLLLLLLLGWLVRHFRGPQPTTTV
jgi:protein-S-isoprenylcysteine O-methyltransferase Ste14